jgi:hypothetical protein
MPANVASHRWSSEGHVLSSQRKDALMCFSYEPERVADAGAYFDQVVARILAEDFAVRQAPEARVCSECDFRAYCQLQGPISLQDEISVHR